MAKIPPRIINSLRDQARHSDIARRIRLPVQQFIHTESFSGLVLLTATIVALIWANSPWSELYHEILHTHVALEFALFSLDLTIEHWINDGLMALFFFVVGLEIKRELFFGHFSSPRRAALPAVAALGGMVVPAAVYVAFNLGSEGMRGWGIPMATDIAFALGVLALLGRRIPMELRVFLLGLAVVDDLGAILVIAVAYTESISFPHLYLVAALVIVTIVVNRLGFRHAAITAFLGFVIWWAMYKSGVHATIAGVIFAFLTPAHPRYSKERFAEESEALIADYRQAQASGDTERTETILGQLEKLTQGTESPMGRLERLVHPWSSYVILPTFALANAGLSFSGVNFGGVISSGVTIGVMAGLLVGKVVGITAFPWVASRLGIVELPRYVSWSSVVGVGFLGGIGFTVAIFISELAFGPSDAGLNSKIGIMVASALAGIVGYSILRLSARGG